MGKKWFAAVAALLAGLLFVSCTNGLGVNEAGNMVAFRYFYIENETYTEHEYTIETLGDEIVFAYGAYNSGGLPQTHMVLMANAEVLQAMQTILEEQNARKWNGYSKAPFFEASRYDFILDAEFERFTLRAESAFSVPEKFETAHEAIVEYLQQCAQTLPKRALNEDEVEMAVLRMPENVAITIYANNADTQYSHGDTKKVFPAGQQAPGAGQAYINRALALYNSLPPTLAAEAPVLYLHVNIGNAYYACPIWFAQQAADVYSAWKEEAFVLAGLSPQYDETEAFEIESYGVRFRYKQLFMYIPATIGDVIVDFPSSTVYIEGVAYPVGRAEMEELYEYSDFDLYYGKGLGLYSKKLDAGETAMEHYNNFDKTGYSWLYGYVRGGQYNLFGNTEGTP